MKSPANIGKQSQANSATEGSSNVNLKDSSNVNPKSPTNSDTPISTQDIPSSPVLVESVVDPVVDPVQKYGQEIQKIQTMCSSDKNAVLNDAEKSIQQLNMQNPVEIQNWRDNLTAKLVAAESTCEVAFQEQLRLAEKDSVSEEVIDEWRNTYIALKLRLKEESEARLQVLMGGG